LICVVETISSWRSSSPKWCVIILEIRDVSG
jgi:hypothetical protein